MLEFCWWVLFLTNLAHHIKFHIWGYILSEASRLLVENWYSLAIKASLSSTLQFQERPLKYFSATSVLDLLIELNHTVDQKCRVKYKNHKKNPKVTTRIQKSEVWTQKPQRIQMTPESLLRLFSTLLDVRSASSRKVFSLIKPFSIHFAFISKVS